MISHSQLFLMHQWPHTFLPPPLRPCCACQGCPLLLGGGGGRSNTGGSCFISLQQLGKSVRWKLIFDFHPPPPCGSWGPIKLPSWSPQLSWRSLWTAVQAGGGTALLTSQRWQPETSSSWGGGGRKELLCAIASSSKDVRLSFSLVWRCC